MDRYITMQLQDFEKLLDYLEKKEDPWYGEKLPSKLRELRSCQQTFCPCELHNSYDYDCAIKKQNIDKILDLMRRANIIRPYKARGTTTYSNDNNKTIHHLPPVHVENCTCACEAEEKTYLSEKQTDHIIESYKNNYIKEEKINDIKKRQINDFPECKSAKTNRCIIS